MNVIIHQVRCVKSVSHEHTHLISQMGLETLVHRSTEGKIWLMYRERLVRDEKKSLIRGLRTLIMQNATNWSSSKQVTLVPNQCQTNLQGYVPLIKNFLPIIMQDSSLRGAGFMTEGLDVCSKFFNFLFATQRCNIHLHLQDLFLVCLQFFPSSIPASVQDSHQCKFPRSSGWVLVELSADDLIRILNKVKDTARSYVWNTLSLINFFLIVVFLMVFLAYKWVRRKIRLGRGNLTNASY